MSSEVEAIKREVAMESEKKGREKGRVEGQAEGKAEEIVETGYEFGLSENDILKRLQKKLDISFETAQEYLKKYGRMAV